MKRMAGLETKSAIFVVSGCVKTTYFVSFHGRPAWFNPGSQKNENCVWRDVVRWPGHSILSSQVMIAVEVSNMDRVRIDRAKCIVTLRSRSRF